MLSAAEALLGSMAFQGVAMVEFRSPQHGEPHFLEINPSVGSIALALRAGVDFPLAWLECARDGDTRVRQPQYRSGVQSRDLILELEYLRSVLRPDASPASQPPSKIATLANLARLSVDPRVHGDTLAWLDPSPAVTVFRNTLPRVRGSGIRQIQRLRRTVRDAALLARLRWPAVEAQLPPLQSTATVCFLCFGNICRSPFAERYWKRTPVAGVGVVSAGFHPRGGRPSPRHCREAAHAHDVALEDHRSSVVTSELLDRSDVILVMDLENYRSVLDRFPRVRAKLRLLGLFGDGTGEIADPYQASASDTVEIFQQMTRSLDDLRRRIVAARQ